MADYDLCFDIKVVLNAIIARIIWCFLWNILFLAFSKTKNVFGLKSFLRGDIPHSGKHQETKLIQSNSTFCHECKYIWCMGYSNTHTHTHSYLSWLRREVISRVMVWLLSVISSSSLCSFLFWALEREFSSSTSSSCLFSCFRRTIDLSSWRRGWGRRGEGKRRKRTERIAEVRGKWKEGNKKREGDGYMKREISLGAGGLTGIRSPIKPGGLSPMMFWEESQCLGWGWGIYFSEWNTLYLPNEHTDASAGLGLNWTEPDKSLI